MDRIADKISPWMPLREAVERAGSLEALLPYLCDRSIMARHGGLYFWPSGKSEKPVDNNIPPRWWARAHRIELATGRGYFTYPWASFSTGKTHTRERLAINIELERATVARLFPVVASASSVAPSKKPPPVSWADLEDWYKTYVRDRRNADDPPRREQDKAAADDHFKERTVPRGWLRNLRRDHAPKAWTKAGRKPRG